jgi:hypothetical protein
MPAFPWILVLADAGWLSAGRQLRGLCPPLPERHGSGARCSTGSGADQVPPLPLPAVEWIWRWAACRERPPLRHGSPALHP